MLQRAGYAVAALLAAVSLIGLRAAARAVPHRPIVLQSGAPGVVYEPLALTDARIPVVVLAHGLAGNARAMSALARRVARAGYGVVTFDFHGHGAHPDPLPGVAIDVRAASLRQDMDAAILFARTQPRFDPERVAVAGHSMGGSAALDAASFDPEVDAVVSISGSRHWNGPYAPPNVLFIWAEGDTLKLRRQAEKLAAERAGLQQVVLDRLYGSVERGTAVKASEVEGANHASIVHSADAAERIVAWLGRALGPGASPEPSSREDRGPWCALGLAASAVLLWGLAGTLAGVAPRLEPPAPRRPAAVLGVWVLALAAGVWIAGGSDPELARGPFALVPLALASEVIGALASAGALLIAWGLARGEVALRPLADPATWGAAAFAFGGSYLLLGVFCEPFGVVWPSAARLPWIALGFAALLPFVAASELLLRTQGRAGVWLPPLARLLVLVLLLCGYAAGALSESTPIAILSLLPVLAGLEVAAQRLARRAPNPWLSALIQSAWLSVALCASAPLVG